MPRFAIAPLGLTTEGSTKFKLKGWKCYLKKLQCKDPNNRNFAVAETKASAKIDWQWVKLGEVKLGGVMPLSARSRDGNRTEEVKNATLKSVAAVASPWHGHGTIWDRVALLCWLATAPLFPWDELSLKAHLTTLIAVYETFANLITSANYYTDPSEKPLYNLAGLQLWSSRSWRAEFAAGPRFWFSFSQNFLGMRSCHFAETW